MFIVSRTFTLAHQLVHLVKFMAAPQFVHLVKFMAGFMFLKSLMKGREVVVGGWQATIRGGGKHILMLLQLMEAL